MRQILSVKIPVVLTLFLLACLPLQAADTLQEAAHQLAKGIAQQKDAKVAVLVIPHHNNRISKGSIILSDKLTSLLSQDPRFVVLERNHILESLAEFHLSEAGFLDTKTTKKIGAALGANVIVTGTLADLDHYKTDLNVRAFLISTGQIIAAAETLLERDWDRYYIQNDRPAELNTKPLRLLAKQLVKSLPADPIFNLSIANFLYSRERISTGSFLISEQLLTFLFQNGATLIERRLLNQLFEERKFQQTGFTGPISEMESQIRGLDGIVVGSLTDQKDTDETEVVARVIDLQSGKVVAAKSAVTPKYWLDRPQAVDSGFITRAPVPGAFPLQPAELHQQPRSGLQLEELSRMKATEAYRIIPIPFVNVPASGS